MKFVSIQRGLILRKFENVPVENKISSTDPQWEAKTSLSYGSILGKLCFFHLENLTGTQERPINRADILGPDAAHLAHQLGKF